MADGLFGEPGHPARSLVALESNLLPGPAPIRRPLTEVLTVQDRACSSEAAFSQLAEVS